MISFSFPISDRLSQLTKIFLLLSSFLQYTSTKMIHGYTFFIEIGVTCGRKKRSMTRRKKRMVTSGSAMDAIAPSRSEMAGEEAEHAGTDIESSDAARSRIQSQLLSAPSLRTLVITSFLSEMPST